MNVWVRKEVCVTKKATKLLTGISESVSNGDINDNQKEIIEYAITAILIVFVMICLLIMYITS